MATTYLQAVNSVLLRLREDPVGSIQQTTYSQLVGQFVNDTIRSVSDAYDWDSLRTTLQFATVAGQSDYSLTGFKDRFKITGILLPETNIILEPTTQLNSAVRKYSNNGTSGVPTYYVFYGVDANGDTVVRLTPTPDKAYQLRVEAVVPQQALENDADLIRVPPEPVILAAFARAIVERGEDAGLQSSEAFLLASRSLADAVALQAHRGVDYTNWVAV
jgi:hypothetical protein